MDADNGHLPPSLLENLALICRFIVCSGFPKECIPLAAHLIQFLVDERDEVTQLVRSTLKAIRKASPEKLIPLYAEALKLSFEGIYDEDNKLDETGWEHFVELCRKIAGTFVTVHAPHTRASVVQLLGAGMEHAFQVCMKLLLNVLKYLLLRSGTPAAMNGCYIFDM